MYQFLNKFLKNEKSQSLQILASERLDLAVAFLKE